MNGIELIAKERQEQQEKHGISVKNDAQFNSIMQFNGLPALPLAVVGLLDDSFQQVPKNWDKKRLEHMRSKPYKEKLIIAGALIAAEIDRVQFMDEQEFDREQ
jgi:hypothetical protein